MRIGIDATLVRPDRLTGIERYTLCLCSALARLAPAEVVLFTRPNPPDALRELPVEQHAAPFRHRFPIEQAWLPHAASRAGIDLLHMPAFPTPLAWRGRTVLTVHDATPWLYPETISAGMRYYYGPLYGQALRRAAGVLTVSQASRADLVSTLRLDPGRVHVTHNGVDPAFFSAAPAREGAGGRRSPYLLAVGTLEPRKNLPVLLHAFRQLRAEGRDLELVLVGRQGWADTLALGDVAGHVHMTGQVSDPELLELYAGAACFVLPSLYEGFGLCLAEAMAAGIPAVASDIAALRELAGDTVRYASAESATSFADAIGKALDHGDEARALATRARERVRAFTWDACAQRTLELYRALAPARAQATAPEPLHGARDAR